MTKREQERILSSLEIGWHYVNKSLEVLERSCPGESITGKVRFDKTKIELAMTIVREQKVEAE